MSDGYNTTGVEGGIDTNGLRWLSGRGAPIAAILSWMEYKAFAEVFGAKLVPNSKSEDASQLASVPLRAA